MRECKYCKNFYFYIFITNINFNIKILILTIFITASYRALKCLHLSLKYFPNIHVIWRQNLICFQCLLSTDGGGFFRSNHFILHHYFFLNFFRKSNFFFLLLQFLWSWDREHYKKGDEIYFAWYAKAKEQYDGNMDKYRASNYPPPWILKTTWDLWKSTIWATDKFKKWSEVNSKNRQANPTLHTGVPFHLLSMFANW